MQQQLLRQLLELMQVRAAWAAVSDDCHMGGMGSQSLVLHQPATSLGRDLGKVAMDTGECRHGEGPGGKLGKTQTKKIKNKKKGKKEKNRKLWSCGSCVI